MSKQKSLEVIFWSIAFPGFGQLLNGKFLKGALFIFTEFLVNMNSHFNSAIRFSFLGQIEKAIGIVDFQWLMFYPCIYMFSMYDAYRDATPERAPYMFLPFAFGAYFVTTGLMYSTHIRLFGILLGPVWFPMLSLLPGLLTGLLLRWFLLRRQHKPSS